LSSFSTLVQDVYKVLEDGKLSDHGLVEKYAKDIGDVLSKRFNNEERSPSLRMSNIGRPLRQLWYDLNGYEGEKISGKTLLKFSYGDATEALLLFLIQAAGHEVTRCQEQIEVSGVKGHIDCVIDGVLVDIKSCSSYSFQKFKEGTLLEEDNDPFGYVGQLAGYAHALKLPAAWVAFDKQSGEVCVLELPQEKIDGYDVLGRIEVVRQAVSSSELPERCYQSEPDGKSGNEKLSIGCSYCSYKYECWKDSNGGEGVKTYLYSTGPRFLVKIIREPKVFSINKKEEE